jgi:imidazole glycerol-phosphate synthase subunit HisH
MDGPLNALPVIVVRTGTANLASIAAGLRRAGADPQITDDRRAIEAADQLVLPGVGAFGAAMQNLRSGGLDHLLADRVSAGRPTLAICLGLQLLGEGSEESPGFVGLSVVSARATSFPGNVRVPQLGWNRVEADPECRMLASGSAYFANSYRFVEAPTGWTVAYADHGGRFVAAMERGAVLACQFHPELSGPWGLSLLRAWLTGQHAANLPLGCAATVGGASC